MGAENQKFVRNHRRKFLLYIWLGVRGIGRPVFVPAQCIAQVWIGAKNTTPYDTVAWHSSDDNNVHWKGSGWMSD